MNEEEIEKIIEMTINKSNKEYISLKKQFDELLSDYIELSRIEEKQEKVIEEVRDVIEKMIDVGYVDGMTCYYPTKNDSEFGVRAKILLQILDKGENNE